MTTVSAGAADRCQLRSPAAGDARVFLSPWPDAADCANDMARRIVAADDLMPHDRILYDRALAIPFGMDHWARPDFGQKGILT